MTHLCCSWFLSKVLLTQIPFSPLRSNSMSSLPSDESQVELPRGKFEVRLHEKREHLGGAGRGGPGLRETLIARCKFY